MAQDDEEKAAEERTSLITILLVEDDPNIGDVLVQAIEQETPYLAVLAENGLKALHAVQGIKPNLFILDYHLPHMNGIELYDRLHAHEELAHIPAMLVSARLPHEELAQRNIRGMNKPLDLDEFLQAIDELLK